MGSEQGGPDFTSSGTWDYIIVGAGSAGCVLANRLTTDRRTTVLVLEAGPEATGVALKVPALIQKIDSGLNWLYPVEPDPSRHGTVDAYSGGRVVGGGSTINAMMWVRGNPRDFDGWAAAGCVGWDYNSVLPYFRRAERFEDGLSPYRGGEGPLSVVRMRVPHRMTDAFVEGAHQSGFALLDDYNAEEQEGVAISQVSQRGGLRDGAATAFLAPARSRPNLTVETGALVTRIVIDGGRAVGVSYRPSGEVRGASRVANAGREVIVCAGAIASPKILMLSGIGAPDELGDHGIPVVADLPGVGKHLQDHPATSLVYEVTERTLNQDVTPTRLLIHGANFALRRQGAVTSSANHAVAFGRLDPSSPVPDVELIFVAYGLSAVGEGGPDHGSQGVHGVLRRLTARTGGRAEGRRQVASDPLVTVHAALLHPRATGQVSLRSSDPMDSPRIRHDVLADPQDIRDLTSACTRIRDIFETPALQPFVRSERTPGPSVTTDSAWEDYFRETTFRLFHASSTCRMGTDRLAVVDPRLRVRGVDSLRVVDASIMPTITSGNTMAPTMMIAERASDLIRADAR